MQTPSFSLSDDTRHFLAYVPWRTILDWRREEVRAGRLHKGSQLKPYAYATRIRKAYDYLRKGDVIWIFTIPYYGEYGSFPSLNTMLVVEDSMDREEEAGKRHMIPAYFSAEGEQQQWRYVFLGDQGYSRYFPINNCLELLRLLLSEKAARNLDSAKQRGYGYLGMVFQHARKLSAEQGKRFYEFQQNIRKQKTLFISYRHGEEPEIVDELVKGLLRAKVNCWQDLNRIPRGIADDAGEEPEAFFKEELLSAVEECDGLLALESEAYWKSFWTGLEYGAGQALTEVKPGFRLIEAGLASLASAEARRKLIEEASQAIAPMLQMKRQPSSDGVR